MNSQFIIKTKTPWLEPAGGNSAARLTCLKMSSKLGRLLGSSFQHSFIKLRHSAGASSTETSGLQRGGGSFRRSSISERQTGTQTGHQADRQTDRQTDRWFAERRGLLQMLQYLWETDRHTDSSSDRHKGGGPVSPWAGMSIMAYGSVLEITSCMMMEKLKTSPANDPPRIGFLKSSGAVHSSSSR